MDAENKSYQKSSFGPAFFFLSKRRKAALAAYYEFCRLMDDIADEPGVDNPSVQLDFWQAEIQRIFDGTAQTALGRQLAVVARDFGLTPDRFMLLLEGMRADLNGQTYATLDELDGYIYRVAVIVGLATLDILGVKGPKANALAHHLGSAVQLTNIIRDVAADAQLRRVYLPQDILTQYGLTRREVLDGTAFEKLVPLLTQLAGLARTYYCRADEDMAQLPRFKMLPCRMMGCVYAKNLAKIEEAGFVVAQPIKLTKSEKMIGVFHALFQTFFC